MAVSFRLSSREIELLRLLSKGFSNKEVASRMKITENTVKSYSKSVYKKLGANNRMRAVSIAMKNKFIH